MDLLQFLYSRSKASSTTTMLTLVQQLGDFMITFPNVFNYGINVAKVMKVALVD